MAQVVRYTPLLSGLLGVICALPPAARAGTECTARLRLIGMYAVPPLTRVDGDLFGGISGLDYDSRRRQWYLVSDDRSEYSPARFFVAQLEFDSHRVRGVTLRATRHVQSVAGHRGSAPPPAAERIDPETIRLAPRRDELLMGGEQDAGRHTGPWLRRVDLAGHWLGDLPLPARLKSPGPSAQYGPRLNRSLEGLAPAQHGDALWIAMEAPLLQDGTAASETSGADVRLTRLQRSDGTVAEYVYATEAAHAHSPGESSDNGISEILVLNERELLVLERSGVKQIDGHFRFHTRLYCAEWTGATDVASFDSLAGRTYERVTKRLLLDFDELPGVVADNLEGMAWGPRLAGARRSLVLVSDNNFFSDVPTQLLFFEVRR